MTINVIAIDGPAASGKGTLGRALAKALQFDYLDTGALYRATAFELLSTGFSAKDKNDARDCAQILVHKIKNAGGAHIILDHPSLREDKVGREASIIATYPEVREVLDNFQKEFAKHPPAGFKGTVLDGRDIGTVICPDAPLKLFVTADVEIRAQRRVKELQSRGISCNTGDVLNDMRERDARDENRKDAPMKAAKDAIIIDSSTLNASQMLEKALLLAKRIF